MADQAATAMIRRRMLTVVNNHHHSVNKSKFTLEEISNVKREDFFGGRKFGNDFEVVKNTGNEESDVGAENATITEDKSDHYHGVCIDTEKNELEIAIKESDVGADNAITTTEDEFNSFHGLVVDEVKEEFFLNSELMLSPSSVDGRCEESSSHDIERSIVEAATAELNEMFSSVVASDDIVPEKNSKKSFCCSTCLYRCYTQAELLDHFKVHSGIKFECKKCSMRFNTESYLKSHMATHKLQCSACSFRSNSKQGLNLHRKHCGKRPRETDSDETETAAESNDLSVETDADSSKGDKEKDTSQTGETTLNTHTATFEQGTFKCTMCSFKCESKQGLAAHCARWCKKGPHETCPPGGDSKATHNNDSVEMDAEEEGRDISLDGNQRQGALETVRMEILLNKCPMCSFKCASKQGLSIHRTSWCKNGPPESSRLNNFWRRKNVRRKNFFRRKTSRRETDSANNNDCAEMDVEKEGTDASVEGIKKQDTQTVKYARSLESESKVSYRETDADSDETSLPVLHSSRTWYYCPKCEYKCHSLAELISHFEVHSGGENVWPAKTAGVENDFSPARHSSETDRLSHSQRHSDEKNSQKKPKSNLSKLGKNKKTVSRVVDSKKSLCCSVCFYRCYSQADLFSHFKTHSGEKSCKNNSSEKLFCCAKCLYRCYSASDLILHFKTHSSDESVSQVQQKNELSSHKKNGSKRKSYCCSKCIYRCSSQSELLSHFTIHSKEETGPQIVPRVVLQRIKLPVKTHKKNTVNRSYSCSKCYYRCSSQLELMSHFKVHSGEKSFPCQKCSEEFETQDELNTHLITYCPARFKTKSGLKSHLYRKLYQCTACLINFETKQELQSHIATHIGYECAQCSAKFQTQSGLEMHSITHAAEERFECAKCDLKFESKGSLESHLAIHSNVEPPFRKQAGLKTQASNHFTKCACPAKVQQKQAIDHSEVKLGSSPQCSEEFSKMKHLDVHDGEKYSCPEKFPSKDLSAGEHKALCPGKRFCSDQCPSRCMACKWHVDSQEPPYQCHKCRLTFKCLNSLKQHRLLFHVSTNLYVCDKCQQSFRSKSDLNAHSIRHSSENGYPRPKSITFKSLESLELHSAQLMDEKKYMCQHCLAKFQELWQAKQHIVRCPLRPQKSMNASTVQEDFGKNPTHQ